MTVAVRQLTGPDAVAETTVEAAERNNLYGFLAVVFQAEPTAALLRGISKPAFQGALLATNIDLGIGSGCRSEQDLLNELAVEFTRLFVGPGDHVPPYAAVYLGGEGASLWGTCTAWVKNYIEAAGFEYRPGYADLPDHISVELEFMRELTGREAKALGERNHADVARLRTLQAEFIDRHLGIWVPSFCDQVISRAKLPFYEGIAIMTKGFVKSEPANILDDR